MKTLIIAEVGSNHGGFVATAMTYIEACAKAGADAVKLQTMHPGKLTRHPSAFTPLRDEDYADLFALAHDLGVKAFSTPFDLESVRILADAGADFTKVASGDLTYHDLIREAARTGLPCFISTGMGTLAEVERAVEIFTGIKGHGDLTLLHCVSLYPTELEEANVLAVRTLRDAFGLPVGLSDHSPGHVAALGAVALGAVAVEKHVTFDRSLPGCDHHFAMEMDELDELICHIRDLENALGDGDKCPNERERGRMAKVRRGYYATRDLPEGTVLTRSDVVALRPQANFVPPSVPLVGRTLRAAKAKGDGIEPLDLVMGRDAAPIGVERNE
jgi:N,N'-diacetyllegionaminate synthase